MNVSHGRASCLWLYFHAASATNNGVKLERVLVMGTVPRALEQAPKALDSVRMLPAVRRTRTAMVDRRE